MLAARVERDVDDIGVLTGRLALRYPRRAASWRRAGDDREHRSYERGVDTLERELGIIEDTFQGLSGEDWSSRTHHQPIDPELPRWTLQETFAKTIQESRATSPDTVGPGFYALMRLDEFVPSRVVKAVVHGIDLAWIRAASGRQQHPDPRLPLVG